MEHKEFLGHKLSDIKPYLLENGVNYSVVELKDRKNTKMGDELRIVKVEEKEKTIIYVAYF
jgi:hypothetical protein